MKNSTIATKELLETYYKGFAQKSGWEPAIADDFKFGIGGKSTPEQFAVGKNTYIQIIKGFYRSYDSMKIKDMIVEPNKACVTATYILNSNKGTKLEFDIAEIWTISDNKLTSLTIYYDTVTYNGFIVNGR